VRRRFERRRPPILEVIAGWDDGPPPALPDEGPDDGRTIRWGAGALDGVVARDGAREPARGAVLAALIQHAATGDADAARALYEAARGEGIVFALDAALDALEAARVRRELVADLGRRMLREASHREPLKLAVALVGRAGDRDDVPLLETLARHDEFSVVAGAALASLLDDPVQAWWRVACLATGWGKVEAVARLAAIPDLPGDVRAWMLRHGCDNDVMPEYLAYACAVAGRGRRARGRAAGQRGTAGGGGGHPPLGGGFRGARGDRRALRPGAASGRGSGVRRRAAVARRRRRAGGVADRRGDGARSVGGRLAPPAGRP
jgi:hypothetical protein